MSHHRSTWSLLIAATLALVMGCSSSEPEPSGGGGAGLQILSFTAEDELLDFGGSTLLSWRTRGAEAVTLLAGDEVLAEGSEPSGLLTVTPPRTRQYRLRVESASGDTKEETLVVAVRPAILEFEAVEDGHVAVGRPAALRWKTGGATRLLLSGEGFEHEIPASEIDVGTAEVAAPTDGKVRLLAESGELETSAELTLDVVVMDPPEVSRFEATPLLLTAGVPEVITLSWASSGASSLALYANEEPVDVTGLSPSEGSVEVVVEESTRFTLEVSNLAGPTTAELEVEALPPPRIDELRAVPSRVGVGERFELVWRTSDAVAVELHQDGLLVDTGVLQPSGSMQRHIAADATFLLRAFNAVGASTEAELTVSVGLPIVRAFDASPALAQPGTPVVLSWRSDGGSRLAIEDPDGIPVAACQTADPYLVAEGSCTFDAPDRGGLLTYTLVAENEHGDSTTATTSFQVVTGPLDELPTIQFDTSSTTYDPLVQEGVRLRWTSSRAIHLSIWALDEGGFPIEPPILSTNDPALIASGELEVDPDVTTTYRAAATNIHGDDQFAHTEVELLLVEIDRFDAAPLEVLEGGITTLSWATRRALSVSLDYDVSYSFSQGALPFVELRDRETAHELPISGTCGGRAGDASMLACPTLELEDFIFPLGGSLHDRLKVSVNGGVSFDMSPGEVNTTVIEPLPPEGLPWDNMLAVLWNQFVADAGRGSKLLYEYGSEGGRKNLIIEWSQVFPRGGRGDCTKPLSFQVVLWEDGSFDYRYGPFDDYLSDGNCANLNASVGYFSRSANQSAQVLFGSEPAGGLSGTSYSFVPTQIEVNDSVEVPLSASRSFTLTAYGAKGSSVSQTVEVVAHGLPRFVGLIRTVAPQLGWQPQAGEPITLSWETENALELEVLDEEGAVLCSREETSAVKGSCVVSSEIPGPIPFTLRAFGAMGSSTEVHHTVNFLPRFGVEALEANPDAFEYGTATVTTLSWKTHGAMEFTLYEDGVPVDPPVPPNEWAEGQRSFTLDRSRTYRIELGGSDFRSTSAERTVDVISVRPFEVAASPQQTVGEEPVTLSWSATTLGSDQSFVSVEPSMPPMVEVPNTFQDISETGTPVPGFATPGNGAPGTAVIDLPFPFPFFGETYTKAKIGQVGTLGFDPSTNMLGGPVYSLLTWYNTGAEKIHIAPYWANMRTYSVGNAYVQHFQGSRGTGDSFVIQWNKMQLYRDPAPAPGEELDDLTFQLVLFQDGSFEFRYKTMTSPDRPAEAGGQKAATGYRKPGIVRQEVGHDLFFDLPNPLNLNDRAWRYQALKPTDSLVVTPKESTIYRICVHHRGYQECAEIPVAVPKAGDLIVTELQLRPEGGAAGQWFELRNLSHVPIDLAGMHFDSAAGTTAITSETPLWIQPGAYFTLAASQDPGFTPDHVYGATVLGDGEDGIELMLEDRLIHRLRWDESWTIPQGKTLGLDTIHHKLNSDAPTLSSSFCVDEGSPGLGSNCGRPYYVVDPYAPRELIDISTTGTRIQQMDGSSYTIYLPGGLGFEMPFFGDRVNDIWVSANGFLGFRGTPWVGPVAEPLPTRRETGLVAGLWTGLISVGAYWPEATWFAYERLEREGQHVMVLHWEQQRRYTTSGVPENVGDVTIQIQLWENGDIVMIYPSMWGDPMHFGAGATVGIEALDGITGIQYLFEEAALRKDQVLLFEYQRP